MKVKKLDKAAFDLVIGVTGLKAAGKDEFTRYLAEKHGFRVRSCGDEIRAELQRGGFDKPTVDQQIELGNRGRRESGDSAYWVKRVIMTCHGEGCNFIAVNGIRHPLEVEGLRKMLGGKFHLVGIVAPTPSRAQRLISRKRVGDPQTIEEFLDLDDHDRGIGQPWDGQQVDRALALVPWENLYNNVGTLAEYHAWIDALMERLLKKRPAKKRR